MEGIFSESEIEWCGLPSLGDFCCDLSELPDLKHDIISSYFSINEFDKYFPQASLTTTNNHVQESYCQKENNTQNCIHSSITLANDMEIHQTNVSKGSSAHKKRKNRRRKGKLWEFLRDLLNSEDTNPSVIQWVDKNRNTFKIVKSDKVASLWGKHKSNPSMTYNKLSRALRYYYDEDILKKIDGQRLVYKFGDCYEKE